MVVKDKRLKWKKEKWIKDIIWSKKSTKWEKLENVMKNKEKDKMKNEMVEKPGGLT